MIGGFALAFRQRHNFFYRTQTFLEAFAIRKRNWKKLEGEHGTFIKSIKINFYSSYNKNVVAAMIKKKRLEEQLYHNRSDYHCILTLDNIGPGSAENPMDRLRK